MRITSDPINRLADQARQDPEVQTYLHDVRMFDGLSEHAGFRHLRERIEDYRQVALRDIARRLFKGEEVEAREIAFRRGFYEGAKFVTDSPEQAAQGLEREAARYYERALVELQSESEEEKPYE